MNRKSNAEPLKDVLHRLIDQYRLRGKLTEVSIFDTWKEVMGNTISTRTEKIAFQKGVLYVKVNSSPLKSELNMQKQKVLELMNDAMGAVTIKEVVIK